MHNHKIVFGYYGLIKRRLLMVISLML